MVGPLAAQGDEARCSYPLLGALIFFYCNTFPKTDSNSLFLTSAGRAHPTYCSVEVQGGRGSQLVHVCFVLGYKLIYVRIMKKGHFI